MKEIRDILTFAEIDIDKALINFTMAVTFVWLVYTISHLPCFG